MWIDQTVHAIITELLNGVNVFSCPAKVKLLHEECPVIFAALRDLSPSAIPEMWHPMFQEMLRKSLAPFITSASSISSTEFREEEADDLSFFPTLPKRRTRNFYLADAARRKEDICTKKHLAHSFFLPGIFTLFCPHGNFLFMKYPFMIRSNSFHSLYPISSNPGLRLLLVV